MLSLTYCYLVEDFNINLLHSNIHCPTNNFIITLLGHSFVPVIDKPTRVTPNSASLIDNIFTNTNTRNSMTSILISLIAKSILRLLVRFRRVFNARNISNFKTHVNIGKIFFTRSAQTIPIYILLIHIVVFIMIISR